MSTRPYLYINVAAVCLSLCVGKPSGFIPAEIICFLTTFCMALAVRRPPLREINKAFVLVIMEFRIESHLVNDCLTAGVIKILRSLFPFPTTDSISELTWSIFNDVSSDNLKAQFRKIVITIITNRT